MRQLDLWRHALEAAKKGVSFELGVVEPMLHPQYLPLTADGRLRIFPFPYDRVHEPSRRRSSPPSASSGISAMRKVYSSSKS